jgi:hypothetical protein
VVGQWSGWMTNKKEKKSKNGRVAREKISKRKKGSSLRRKASFLTGNLVLGKLLLLREFYIEVKVMF